MRIKKFFAAISAAAMIASVSAVNVSANLPITPSAGDNCYLEFELTADGAYITGAFDEDGNPAAAVETIAIPEKTDAGIPIVGIKGLAFADCNNLKSVTVPDTIKDIDHVAFLRTEDIDRFLKLNDLDTTALTAEDLAYAANVSSYMGKTDWTGDEDELADAVTVFNNVRNTVTYGDSDASMGKTAKCLYNYQDLDDIVRNDDENTLEKMSMKSYESFFTWISTIPYADFTVKANENSYAAEYTISRSILGLKYEINETHLIGDANKDGVVNVRDCALIARAMAEKNRYSELIQCEKCADFNGDGVVNVRDAAQLANAIATGKIDTAVPSNK